MSAPNLCCNSIDFSGVKKCVDPSQCERKVTPSSSILTNELSGWTFFTALKVCFVSVLFNFLSLGDRLSLSEDEALRLFRELKANSLIIHDLLLRMRNVSRGGRVINVYNDFCLPSQATDEQVENYYLGCDHGEFTRTDPRFMPRFDVRIQSQSGFDKF